MSEGHSKFPLERIRKKKPKSLKSSTRSHDGVWILFGDAHGDYKSSRRICGRIQLNSIKDPVENPY